MGSSSGKNERPRMGLLQMTLLTAAHSSVRARTSVPMVRQAATLKFSNHLTKAKMGKGSNVQKAQAARERNQKKLGKSDEERRAAAAKSAKDSSAFICLKCKQTFMVNATKAVLYLHVTSKHPAGTDPVSCFTALQGFDPNDPKGLKAKAAEDAKKAEAAAKKKKAAKGGMGDLDDLLSAGLAKTKKKK